MRSRAAVAAFVITLAVLAAVVVVRAGEGTNGGGDETAATTTTTDAPSTGPSRGAPATTGVSAADHGARGDGEADDTAALQRAVDAAARAGDVLHVPAGTYRLTASIDLVDGLRELRLDEGAVLRQTADAPALRRIGTVAQGPLRVSGAVAGTDTLEIEQATTFAPGTWLVIGSSRLVERDKQFRAGSLRLVDSVAGQRVLLDRPLARDLTDGTEGWRVDPAAPVVISGGVIEHADPLRAFEPLVDLQWVDGPEVRGVEIRQCGGSGLRTVGTLGGAVDVDVHDCIDDQSGARFGAGRHYGYGVEVTGPTRDLTVTGTAHAVRHAFTTNGSYGLADDRLANVGEPEHVDVSMDVWDTTSSGLDTHEQGIAIRFHDCTVRDAGRYRAEGSTDTLEGGFGVFIRAPGTIVERCRIIGSATRGIVVAGHAEGIAPWSPGDSARITQTEVVDSGGRSAIELKQSAIIDRVTIRGAHVFGIQFESTAVASSVVGTTIELRWPETTYAFVHPDDAELRDNVLRTDEERLE